MKKIGFATLALAAALATAPAAMADSFNLYFNGPAIGSDPSISGSGTLTGTEIGVSPDYDITGGTLNVTIGGVTYTTTVVPIANPLVPQQWPNNPGAFPGTTYDNIFIPGTTTVDGNGLLFTLAGAGALNGDYFTFFYSTTLPYTNQIIWDATTGTNSYVIVNGSGGNPLDISQTPEPSSMLLMGTGLLCMAGFLFRKALPSVS